MYSEEITAAELDGARNGFVQLVSIQPNELPKEYDPNLDSWVEVEIDKVLHE